MVLATLTNFTANIIADHYLINLKNLKNKKLIKLLICGGRKEKKNLLQEIKKNISKFNVTSY